MRFINYFSDYLSSRKFISEGRRLFLFSGSSIVTLTIFGIF